MAVRACSLRFKAAFASWSLWTSSLSLSIPSISGLWKLKAPIVICRWLFSAEDQLKPVLRWSCYYKSSSRYWRWWKSALHAGSHQSNYSVVRQAKIQDHSLRALWICLDFRRGRPLDVRMELVFSTSLQFFVETCDLWCAMPYNMPFSILPIASRWVSLVLVSVRLSVLSLPY